MFLFSLALPWNHARQAHDHDGDRAPLHVPSHDHAWHDHRKKSLRDIRLPPNGWFRTGQEGDEPYYLQHAVDPIPIVSPPTLPPPTVSPPTLSPPIVSPPTLPPPIVSPPTLSFPIVSPPTLPPPAVSPFLITAPTVPPPFVVATHPPAMPVDARATGTASSPLTGATRMPAHIVGPDTGSKASGGTDVVLIGWVVFGIVVLILLITIAYRASNRSMPLMRGSSALPYRRIVRTSGGASGATATPAAGGGPHDDAGATGHDNEEEKKANKPQAKVKVMAKSKLSGGSAVPVRKG